MYDLIIRNGTIVDGTGETPFVGDVAIQDDRIVQVGKVDGTARRFGLKWGRRLPLMTTRFLAAPHALCPNTEAATSPQTATPSSSTAASSNSPTG